RSGGDAQFIASLACAGAAMGIDGLFLEVHDRPARALSDGANSIALKNLPALLARVLRVHQASRAPARAARR
ncbi:MAG: 3-deoxy-8-phosphooctulonate synthase, partial [Vicinamibacteria bacterium]|nr:3-deoxy-8-phosphooctulonate synthase [Vicinamibacteria bacterium]